MRWTPCAMLRSTTGGRVRAFGVVLIHRRTGDPSSRCGPYCRLTRLLDRQLEKEIRNDEEDFVRNRTRRRARHDRERIAVQPHRWHGLHGVWRTAPQRGRVLVVRTHEHECEQRFAPGM